MSGNLVSARTAEFLYPTGPVNTSPVQASVLFIDDSQSDVDTILRALRRGRIRGDWRRVSDPQTLPRTLDEFKASIVLAAYPVRGFAELEALNIVRALRPDLPFVYITNVMDEEQRISALRDGAADVIKREHGEFEQVVRRILAQANDRSVREHAQRRLSAQYEIARILAEGEFIRETITKIFRVICQYEGFVAASMWKISAETDALHCVDIWTQNAPALDAFAAESRTLKIGPGVGLAGRAWEKRAPVWISDVTNVRNVPSPAINARLRSGMAFPITLHNEIRGVMVFWGFEVREEDPDMLEMFRAIGNQIGQFMEREAQRAHITRLNRVYAVMSDINHAIVRVTDRQHLFNEACRIAIEKGNFGIAWIGQYDAATQEVTPVAWGGLNAEELVAFKSTARAEAPDGQGTVGQAVRTRQPAYANDLAMQPGPGGRRRAAVLRRGFRSQITLPLLPDREVVGVLSLSAAERDFFNEDEVRLLTELAANLSFALAHLAKKEQIDYLVNRDAVTGVANRNLLDEHLSHAIAQAKRAGSMVAVAVLHIENIRLINESLGHHVGDALLKIVVARVSSCIRKTDTLARLGNSELVLVLPLKSDAMAVKRVMDRIASTVFEDAAVVHTLQHILVDTAQPLKIDGRELQPQCSMGVSIYPQDGTDNASLLRNAAAAASDASEHATTGFRFYTPDLNLRLSHRLTLQAALRHALERNEFSLYYQPKLNLVDGRSSGVEALLRWDCPGSGMMLPDSFLDMLEETGQIIEVGRWAMEQAVADCQKWGFDQSWLPRIAVNVSALQLEQPDFPASVEQILRTFGGSGPVRLDLEITESLIMQNVDANVAKLAAVRDLGVDIIIDDFGTGYSSLSYLAKLPGNTLKIDRSFVQDMTASPQALTIVSTIISLAHALGLKVVAEGVESESQKDALLQLKCDEIQGYLVSPPLPLMQLESWWSARHAVETK